MKKDLIYFMLVVWLFTMLAACGSGGGGGDNGGGNNLTPPVANISGSWTNTGTVDANTCGDPVGAIRTETATIVHTTGSNSFTLTNDKGHSYTGTINGTHLSYSGPGENTDCPLGVISTVTLDLRAPDYTTAAGYSTDACKRSSGTCTKNTRLSATCNNCSGVDDVEKPSVPTGLTATAASSAQVNLSWTASTDNKGVTGYKIYRNGTFLKSSTGVSISDTGLTENTQHCYKVSAYDAAGNESDQSTEQCATTLPSGGSVETPPTVPMNLTATVVSSEQIDLSWTASTDDVMVNGYKIYRGGVLLKSVSVDTFTSDAGLTKNTTYCYTVTAYDEKNNESLQSTQACAKTPSATTVPIAPGSVGLSSRTHNEALMTWTDKSTNETGFQIGTCSGLVAEANYKSVNPILKCTSGFTVVGQVGTNVTSFLLSGLDPQTMYSFFVRAYNIAGFSDALGITFRTQAPPAAKRYLRVINDLYDKTYYSETQKTYAYWGDWNKIIRVRIAATESGVTNSNTYEKLAPCESGCTIGNLYSIVPKYQQTTSYKDFDVSSLPTTYYVYIQCGSWDLELNSTVFWAKHPTAVVCCNCTNLCYKYIVLKVTDHNSGTETITGSNHLPDGNWCNSGSQYCQ